MIVAHHKKDTYILNFERGEELLSSLRAFLEKENINETQRTFLCVFQESLPRAHLAVGGTVI